ILILHIIVALSVMLIQKCSFFSKEENFKAGIAIADVTPKVGVSLSGILQKYGAIKEVLDPLKVRALAMNDGKTTLIMVVGDVCVISGEIIEKAKLLAFKKTGIPTSQMLVAATHTHAAPRVADWNVNEFDEEYYNFFAEQIAGVIQKSIENMVPAQAGFGIINKPDYLQNRRWIMKSGTIPPNPFGDTTDQVVMGGHPIENRVKSAGQVDPDLTVLSIQYANGSPLAVLANYGI